MGDPKQPTDPSLLLVRVFFFADKVGILDLQNVTLDAIRDRATGQHTSSATLSTTDDMSQHYRTELDEPPPVPFSMWSRRVPSPEPRKSDVKYLPLATSTAVCNDGEVCGDGERCGDNEEYDDVLSVDSKGPRFCLSESYSMASTTEVSYAAA